MSTQTVTKKRKSVDGVNNAVKKTRISKSADKPQPLKSALKKTKQTKKLGQTVKDAAPNGSAEEDNEETETTMVTEHDGEEEEEAQGGSELTPDQTAALLAGFSSSDENEDDADNDGIPISTLPKPPTAKKTSAATTTTASDPETTPRVLYVGHIPHGFYEPQMRAYFTQFGSISNLRLARNKKTGKSQHYAFIEFESGAVAEIVRKTMDKYLMFGRILQVRSVPRESVSEGMFKGSARKGRRPAPRNRMEGTRLRKGVTRDVWELRVGREEERRRKKVEVLREMGYEFEMPGVKGVGEVPVKAKEIEVAADVGVAGGEAVVGGEDVALEEKGAETMQTSPVEADEKVEGKKKRSATGKTHVKKAVKKVKT